MIKISLAAIVVLAASGAHGQTGDWRDSIKPNGWSLFQTEPNSEVYFRIGPAKATPTGHPLIWMRQEYSPTFREAEGIRSTASLLEIDCASGRQRLLQSSSFLKSNLNEPVSSSGPDAWSYPQPGTVVEFPQKLLCGRDPLK